VRSWQRPLRTTGISDHSRSISIARSLPIDSGTSFRRPRYCRSSNKSWADQQVKIIFRRCTLCMGDIRTCVSQMDTGHSLLSMKAKERGDGWTSKEDKHAAPSDHYWCSVDRGSIANVWQKTGLRWCGTKPEKRLGASLVADVRLRWDRASLCRQRWRCRRLELLLQRVDVSFRQA